MQYFKIMPVLGRKTDVPADDPSMFKPVSEGVFATHDPDGYNFSLVRKRNACTKSLGTTKWSNSATGQATKCLGMHELRVGVTTIDHILADNGKLYAYDSSLNPNEITYTVVAFTSGGTDTPTLGAEVTQGSATGTLAYYTVTSGSWAGGDAAGNLYIVDIDETGGAWGAGQVGQTSPAVADLCTSSGADTPLTLANNDQDLYSIITVGDYAVIADRGENVPLIWKSDYRSVRKLIDYDDAGTYTDYKFRYLQYFLRSIFGFYSDQANGDIEIRWTDALPTLGAAVEFPSANILYCPNDDPITGARLLGSDKCMVYCRDSVNHLVSFPDYTKPFRIFTAVANQGAAGHHSIVPVGNVHYLFNRNYGFCVYDGGPTIQPVSQAIEPDIEDIEVDAYKNIVGVFLKITRQVAWAVPADGSSTPNQIWFYNIDTGDWTIEKSLSGVSGIADENGNGFRYIDSWRLYSTLDWGDFQEQISGKDYVTSEWGDAGASKWSDYTAMRERLVMCGTDGELFFHGSESIGDEGNLLSWRYTPVMDFGIARHRKLVKEIWVDLCRTESFDLQFQFRTGDTLGEVLDATWASYGSLSHDSPSPAVLRNTARSGKLFQIRFGSSGDSQVYQVSGLAFGFDVQEKY